MSLLNKMLRDLDQRHAPSLDRDALPHSVHVLPEKRSPSRVRPLLVAMLLLAVAGYAWLAKDAPPAPVPPVPPAPQAARPDAPPPSPPSLVANEPPAATAPPSSQEAETAPAKAAAVPAKLVAAPVAAATAGPPVRLRMDRSAPAPALSVAPAAAAAAPEKPPAKTADAAPAEHTSIDKRARTASANETADAEYRKAMAALRRGGLAEAKEGFHAALRLDAHYASARQALLSLLVEQQQLAEAQALMEDGLALDPAQSSWAIALARLQLETNKVADAAETLARHARHAEQNAEYQAFQALLFGKQKRYREASDRYRAALALKPTESRWWYGLGLMLEQEQKNREAREAFLKARETGNLTPELAAAVEARLR